VTEMAQIPFMERRWWTLLLVLRICCHLYVSLHLYLKLFLHRTKMLELPLS
jgi:hypothetical protein